MSAITYPIELRSPVGTFLFADKDAYARHIVRCPKGHVPVPGADVCQRCCTVELPLILEEHGFRGKN